MNNILLENYIKSILDQNKINSLHVFDFDMTLYNHEKKDWIQKVVKQLKKSLQSPKVRVILCTARTNKPEYILDTENLLNQNNMSLKDFDYCYFKSANRKEKTPRYKSNVILDEICANDNITIVKFWDDRKDTLDQVKVDIEKYNNKIEYIPVKC